MSADHRRDQQQDTLREMQEELDNLKDENEKTKTSPAASRTSADRLVAERDAARRELDAVRSGGTLPEANQLGTQDLAGEDVDALVVRLRGVGDDATKEILRETLGAKGAGKGKPESRFSPCWRRWRGSAPRRILRRGHAARSR